MVDVVRHARALAPDFARELLLAASALMGLGWQLPLPGPFTISGRAIPLGGDTVWKHARCHIRHRMKAVADTCATRARPAALSR